MIPSPVVGRRFLSLASVALLLTLAASPALSSQSMDEQNLVQSCLSGIFGCFPPDSNDPSHDTCSDLANFTCGANCPSDGGDYYNNLWTSKNEQLTDKCDIKFCYTELDGCLGSVLNAAYSSGDWSGACIAWAEQSSCISTANDSCTDQEIFSKYFNLFNYGCASSSTMSFLASFAKCFPFSFFDLTQITAKTDLCRGSSKFISSGNALMKPADLSSTAGAFFDGLLLSYSNGCANDQVCKSVLTDCLGNYVQQSLPTYFLQTFICSNIQDLDKCVENTEYQCSYPDEVDNYLKESCYELVCEAGLESCYSQFQTPLDYSSDVATVVASFCSVSGNITACLDDYSEPCGASQNADASLRSSISDLCQGNAMAPGACYWTALQCFYQYFPTLTKPSALWSASMDTMFCSNVDATVNCLATALDDCSSATDKYSVAIENLMDVIGLQCSSVCSYQKVSACKDSMEYYLVQVWTNTSSSTSLCGTLSQQKSCYTTLSKQCSGTTNPSVNAAVLNSIQVAIEDSSCNFTTTPMIPSGCDVPTPIRNIVTFLNMTYMIADLSANNYSALCQLWTTTKMSLMSTISSCPGGIADRINALVAAVDGVIGPLCRGECHLEDAAPAIGHLNDQVQASLRFKNPVDYKGMLKKMFCKSHHSEDSEDDDVCYDYSFYWGSICLQINATEKVVADDTQQCSDIVKKTQMDSVRITADIYDEKCQTQEFVCDVDMGSHCLTNYSLLSVYYPLMTPNEQLIACSLASNYTSYVWSSLVQCTPFFSLEVWQVLQAWFGEWKCKSPTAFDNTSQPLNTTKYEKSCSADLVIVYLKKFVDVLISHSQDCTGDHDDLTGQWNMTRTSITSILMSVASDGKCVAFVEKIKDILKTIDIEITTISENETGCHLDDAYACVDSLQKFVDERGLKKPPCGCPVSSTDETKSEFCSRAKMALKCIADSTVTCKDDAVTDAYAKLYAIQNSTDVNCMKPCDSNPCQHGSICSDAADGVTYMCKCPAGFSGIACEKIDCDKKKILDCYMPTVQSLFAANYSEYCMNVDNATKCISETTMKCPSPYFDVASNALQQLTTGLQSHCDTTVPMPTPDCDGACVTCLNTKFQTTSRFWDMDYGGLSDSVCSQWTAVKVCVTAAVGQCSSSTLSVEAVFSFLCTTITAPCHLQEVVDNADDFNYGCWRANAKHPKKIMDYDSPDDELGDVCPVRKQKRMDNSMGMERHGRHENDKPKPSNGMDNGDSSEDEDSDDDEYEDDACWYAQKQLNKTLTAISDCPKPVQDSINGFVNRVKAQYLSDGQCDEPCEDNQCSNIATCMEDNYGYDCQCLTGYKGPFCDDIDTNVTVVCNTSVSRECLSSSVTILQSIINGPYSAMQCSSLDEKISCLSTSYLSCDNAANSANFQLINFLYKEIKTSCVSQKNVVKTCELNASVTSLATLITGVLMQSGTYCSLLEANYQSALNISVVCSAASDDTTDFTSRFTSQSYSSFSLLSCSDECSVEEAKASLEILYNKVTFNIGDRSVCDIAVDTEEALSEYLKECDFNIRVKFYSLYDSYMSGVRLQCTDACATQPCGNGGTCTRTQMDDGFNCTCSSGFGGKYCDSPTECDSYAIEMCIEMASSVFVSLFDPCQTADCSQLTQLALCMNTHSTGCSSTKKSLIAAAASAVGQLSTTCASHALACTEPPGCLTSNIIGNGSDYIYKALVNITSDIGPSFEDICGSYNMTSSQLMSILSMGCSSTYTTAINRLITWMKSISGQDCSTPTTCQVPQAQSCIDSYNSKVADAEKSIYCPIAQRKEIDKLDQEKEKCVMDNTKKCTDDEKAPVKDALDNSTKDAQDLVPKPCAEEPCTDNATCIPFESGKFMCKCMQNGPTSPVDENCYKEPDCKLNDATDCVNSFEEFAGLNGYFGKDLDIKAAGEFCKRADTAHDCVVKATEYCSSDLCSSNLNNLYGIQAAVGWTCFGYCDSKPCKNNGACHDKVTPASYPAKVMLPKRGYTCKCAPGYSGDNCDMPDFSIPTVNQCFVDVLKALITGDSQSLCSGPLVPMMASCISANVTSCPVGRRAITNKISSAIQDVLQGTICPVGTGSCSHTTLTDRCFSAFSNIPLPLWNQDKHCGDENYCRKVSQLQSCMVTGCDSVVISVREMFDLVCDNSSTPLVNITDILDVIERIVYQKNNTDSKPPPVDTTPRDKPEDVRILYVTAITEKIVYIDGVIQDGLPGGKDYTVVITIIISHDVQLITIIGKTDDNSTAGIIASTNDHFINTDATWKCSSVGDDGWEMIDYDDSGWPRAVLVDDNDLKMCHRDKRFNPEATFIWTQKKANGYDNTVYCRAFFGNRQIRVGASCFFELYIDGDLQDVTNNNMSDTVCKTPVDSGSHAIAIHSSCPDMTKLYGFILEISSSILITDSTWKCSSSYMSGWYLASYDITSWMNAVVVASNDGVKFSLMAGISAKASFIWVADSSVTEIYCRAPQITIPPKTNTTTVPPEPPVDFNHADEDFCWTLQKGIDEINDQLNDLYDDLQGVVQDSLNDLITDSGADETCMQPCGMNKCMMSSKCSPRGFGYDCICLPGFNGSHCDLGGECNIPKAKPCLDKLDTCGGEVMKPGNWRPSVCSKIADVYGCIAVSLSTCSDASELGFKLLNNFLDFVNSTCSNTDMTANPPPVPCETNALLKCGLQLVNDLYVMPTGDSCGNLDATYKCLASIEASCGSNLTATDDLRLEAWLLLEKQCKPPTCSLSSCDQCVYALQNSYNSSAPFDNSSCSQAASSEQCVAAGTSGCDKFLKDLVEEKLSSALEEVNVTKKCVSVCTASHCQNSGVCQAEATGSYNCSCAMPYIGDYCNETTTCSLSVILETLQDSKDQVLDGLLNSCGAPLSCSFKSAVTTNLTSFSSSCDSTVMSTLTMIKTSFTSLTCSSSAPAAAAMTCSTPPVSCQRDVLRACSSSLFDVVSKEYCNDGGGPDYFAICREFNNTMSCFASVTCMQDPFKTDFMNTMKWFQSLVGSKCSMSICEPTVAQKCLSTLNATVNSLVDPATQKVPPVMCKNDQMEFCGSIQSSVECVQGNLAQCASTAQTEAILQQTDAIISNVTGLCPLPCQAMPCADEGVCEQPDASQYECRCPGGVTGDGCKKMPSCDTNSAYASIDAVRTFLFYKGILKSSDAQSPSLPSNFSNDFCSEVVQCSNALSASVMTCDDDTRDRVYSTLSELQSFVNISCVKPCASSPCQNGGVCTDVDSSTYACRCSVGYNGTKCEQDLCPIVEVHHTLWQLLKLMLSSFDGLCSALPTSVDQTKNSTMNCNGAIKNISLTVQQDFNATVSPLCTPGSIGTSPTCTFSVLNKQCMSNFQSLYDYFDDPTEQQTTLLCYTWFENAACIMSMMEMNQCTSVIMNWQEVSSYLCSSPSVTTNTTCDLRDVVTGVKALEQSCWKANETRPSNKAPQPPASVGKCGKYEMPPVNRNPPTESEDVCQKVEDSKKDVEDNSAGCMDSIKQNITDSVKNLTETYLSEGQCDNPCEPNPCAYLGTCSEDGDYGHNCTCMPGFTGSNCETGGACDESSAFTDCYAPVDQFYCGESLQPELCRSVDTVSQCLSQKLLACNSTNDEVVFQLVIKHVQALSANCTYVTANSCEFNETYKANRRLLDDVHESLSMINPQSSVCRALSVYQTSIRNITMVCKGGVISSLTETLIELSYGAQDRVCQNPNCSISAANACIEKLFNTLNGPMDNSTCDASWMHIACVRESTSQCDAVLQQVTGDAVKDVIASSNASCGSPCDTLPCRNNGSCLQTDVDSYECMCTANYTGKYCDIDVDCNLPGVQWCYNDSIEAIASLLSDPCHKVPLNCSKLGSFSDCVSNLTKECDGSTSDRLQEVDSSVTDIAKLCTANRPAPPNCDVPPAGCSVQDIHSCAYHHVEVVFWQYAAVSGPDYGFICRSLNDTKSCFAQFSMTCTADYMSTLNASLEWLSELTGSTCQQTVICKPDTASSTLSYIRSETAIYNARPGSIPDEDHTDFCRKMKDSVASVHGNTDQCANGSQAALEEELESAMENISLICPYPCSTNPCLNGGNCTETTWKDFTCDCEEGFGGMTCKQVTLHPYQNHTKLNCLNQDRSVITQQIRLSVPFQIFCQKYPTLYVTEDGYVSFSDGSLIINFAKFCQTKHTILAPLYAAQDCSCPDSAVYYKEYFVSGSDPDQGSQLERASKDVMRCSSAMAPDFSATSIFVVTWENMMPYPCAIFKGVYGVTQGSTYQLVIASDMSRTFANFIYDMVSVKYQVPFVSSGFTDLQGRCMNSVQSGTDAMDHFETVPSNSSGDNSWIYPLFDDSCATSQPTPEDKCLTWVGSAADLSSQKLDACPCSGRHAAIDPRYHFEYIDWFRYCYATNRVQLVNSPKGRLTSQVKQVCCYDPFSNGTLLTSPPYAGFPVVLDADSTTGNDSQAHLWCCTQSNKYCALFISLRPIGVCNAYTAPIEALLWGDPHYSTLDGLNYTFNAIGEFTLEKTFDNSFNFQGRTSVYTDASGTTYPACVFSSLAAQEAGEVKTEVSLNAARTGLVLFVNGSQTSQNNVQNYYGNVYVAWVANSINITYPSGWTMTSMLAGRSLSFLHTAPNAYRNKTMGLLGNFNGDPADDLKSRDGVVLPPTATNFEIHYQFGLTWQITAAESLLTYPPGKTAADYINASFIPAFDPPCITDADKLAGYDLCGSNKFCYYDYCVTKDTSMAANTKQTVTDYSNNLQILSSLSPMLTIAGLTPNLAGQYVVNAMLNTLLTFKLQATSQQNLEIKYYMVGNISRDLSANLNMSSGVFRWTPSSLNVVDVGFIALDVNGGVSAKLQVIVSMCDGCSNHGTCDFASYTLLGNGTNYRLADCNCNVGWTVPRCSQDFDGCASQPCGSGACTDMTPDQQQQTHLSYSCSSCPPGYYTSQCVDIDECSQGTSQCTQTCMNTIGSYRCGCNKGYRLTNGITCTDIDECREETSSCSQVCTNSQGSYVCSCYPGFQGPNCDPIIPCDAATNNCDYKCSLISSKATCVCQAGYQLGSDGHTCTDVNECSSSSSSNFCSYKNLCTNDLGSYTCGCPNGLQVSSDLRTCQDCPDGYWGWNCSNICNCDMRVRQCNKTNGCTICQSGWTGPDCSVDVDECSLGTYVCSADAVCRNVPGTYECSCLDPTQTNPDNTCGNNQIKFKLRLKLTWKSDYADFTITETEVMKELLELQLQKIFSKIQNYVTVFIFQFFESSVGIAFEVLFDTALSPAAKAAVGQTLVKFLMDNNWTIPVLSNPAVVSVPVADFGNGTDVPAGDPCLGNMQCQNGGTCTSDGISIPTCICLKDYTGSYCESKTTSSSGGSSNSLTIGLAVGLSLGFLFLAVAAILIVYICRRNRNQKRPYDSSVILAMDDTSLNRYDHQPIRYHPKWPFTSGTGYNQTDS